MKVQIDLDNKEIRLMEKVNLDKLIKTLKGMFPDSYKEFNIETNTQVISNYYPWYKWYNGWYTSTPYYGLTSALSYSMGDTSTYSTNGSSYTQNAPVLTTGNNSTTNTTMESIEVETPKTGIFFVDIKDIQN